MIDDKLKKTGFSCSLGANKTKTSDPKLPFSRSHENIQHQRNNDATNLTRLVDFITSPNTSASCLMCKIKETIKLSFVPNLSLCAGTDEDIEHYFPYPSAPLTSPKIRSAGVFPLLSESETNKRIKEILPRRSLSSSFLETDSTVFSLHSFPPIPESEGVLDRVFVIFHANDHNSTHCSFLPFRRGGNKKGKVLTQTSGFCRKSKDVCLIDGTVVIEDYRGSPQTEKAFVLVYDNYNNEYLLSPLVREENEFNPSLYRVLLTEGLVGENKVEKSGSFVISDSLFLCEARDPNCSALPVTPATRPATRKMGYSPETGDDDSSGNETDESMNDKEADSTMPITEKFIQLLTFSEGKLLDRGRLPLIEATSKDEDFLSNEKYLISDDYLLLLDTVEKLSNELSNEKIQIYVKKRKRHPFFPINYDDKYEYELFPLAELISKTKKDGLFLLVQTNTIKDGKETYGTEFLLFRSLEVPNTSDSEEEDQKTNGKSPGFDTMPAKSANENKSEEKKKIVIKAIPLDVFLKDGDSRKDILPLTDLRSIDPNDKGYLFTKKNDELLVLSLSMIDRRLKLIGISEIKVKARKCLDSDQGDYYFSLVELTDKNSEAGKKVKTDKLFLEVQTIDEKDGDIVSTEFLSFGIFQTDDEREKENVATKENENADIGKDNSKDGKEVPLEVLKAKIPQFLPPIQEEPIRLAIEYRTENRNETQIQKLLEIPPVLINQSLQEAITIPSTHSWPVVKGKPKNQILEVSEREPQLAAEHKLDEPVDLEMLSQIIKGMMEIENIQFSLQNFCPQFLAPVIRSFQVMQTMLLPRYSAIEETKQTTPLPHYSVIEKVSETPIVAVPEKHLEQLQNNQTNNQKQETVGGSNKIVLVCIPMIVLAISIPLSILLTFLGKKRKRYI